MRIWISIYDVLAVVGLAFALTGCEKHEQDPRTQPELVRVVPVESASHSERAFTGVVSARVQSDLGFRVPGKITKRFVDAGQAVRAGQPLMRIDVTDFTHAITTQTGNVAAAKARAIQAAADEARYRGLVSTGAVSASAYDGVKAAADAAQAQLSAVEAQAQVARDEGDYSLLIADADGIVVETLAEPGQVVTAGQTVVKLAHSGPREAAVNLPETIRPALGSIAHANLYGTDTPVASARLRQLSDAADPQTRTFEARYVLEGAAAKAPLGATVTIRLGGGEASQPIEVPIAAITDRGAGPGVWVLNPASTISFRPVHVLSIGEESATLSDGVLPGEKIVALGAHLLSNGQQVRIAEEKAAVR
ncbi:efflux RND transporter periplasmic adaptor subunit [Granulicella sp. dw_53]|uniref:efflux RND transporter periplasmic adaptor subunit n=1 Tax=Granulicella sp. dw_53 TaxID=2719792 RepID=UPI001BD3B00A|nr:efflux RND transporter periplasmic adaptor subunit [Granulicella sp. dw_53]